MTSKLFQPIQLGNHKLQHRVVLAPLTRLRASPTAVPSPLMAEYYKQRSTPGGLLITEATLISPTAGGYVGAPGIYTDEQSEAWKPVTEAVHAKGGIIFMQLWHVGRASSSKLMPNNQKPLSASAIAIKGKNLAGDDYEEPRALTKDEIKDVVQDFAAAARRAVDSGFDGVEIHGANGYLVDQFLNTSSNKRTDEYGGPIENRARFGLEVVEAIVDAVGAERTAIRLSPYSGFQDMEDEMPEETWTYFTKQLQDKHPNLAYVHFVEPRDDLMPRSGEDAEKRATLSLDPFRAAWNGPFISAGGYTTDSKLAEEVADKTGNLIAFGRTYIANPDLVARLKNKYPLNAYFRETFYAGAEKGYTDYETYKVAA
ncbi:hypothetical protein BCR43DRAFT_546972 [Syncephalastrum racemosum]|uniref:NADH:flavin oxidoreductase/NADH oxidase N-terminal domain-containing protein n=1 Tax=Syncephalastrum racemosum TaxID=13706 RepID=A0A1X2HGZ5_SYNRA|nr:hypothetical protein BCR43DRAFT_546972 [Syncephalastrum racemosum]